MHAHARTAPPATILAAAIACAACDGQGPGGHADTDGGSIDRRDGGPTTHEETPPYDAAVPVPAIELLDSAALERARFDTSWRRHADDDRRRRLRQPVQRRPQDRAPAPDEPKRPDPSGSPPASGAAPRPPPPALAAPTLAPVPDGVPVLRVQVLLDRVDFSPGAIDGRWGANTAKAVYWFQFEEDLAPTGDVDADTYRRLLDRTGAPATIGYHRIRAEDVDGPFVHVPPDIYDKARLDCLCYESALELLAERFHATPDLLEHLNPGVAFDELRPGDRIRVPNVRPRGAADTRDRDIARIIISRDGAYTHALDDDGRILLHLPSTLGSQYSPSPIGRYRVTAIVRSPLFHYTPTLYHDVPDRRPDAVLPPGPNSPIGGTWIQLSKRYYGIHGTAAPATIGYVRSHGCVRLTNWDARALARRTEPGTPVQFR